jgi:Alpha/beta hydrolase domain
VVRDGGVNGLPYTTPVMVRRPRDPQRFSGTVVLEPIHFYTVLPIWMYVSSYLMRTGHVWAYVASTKSAVDGFLKPSDTLRYRDVHIEDTTEERPEAGLDLVNLPLDPADGPVWWEALHRQNPRIQAIIAQVGAELRSATGPLRGYAVRHVVLAGHSGTGDVVTNYIRQAHDQFRLNDGGPIFDGFFPSGWTTTAFGPCDVPIVQVVTQGDVTYSDSFYRDGMKGFGYRRPDSDDPTKRYRLYELAGFGHTSTQYPPTNDYEFLKPFILHTMPDGVAMSALPFNQLYHVLLDSLIRWVSQGVTPPRGDRMELGRDGWFATDDVGNTCGGVRCAEMDVPRAKYVANPPDDEGVPAFGGMGFELPLPGDTLRTLYKDHGDYVRRFIESQEELIAAGWLLAEDAQESRHLAAGADVP